MSRRPTATILKLIQGNTAHANDRHKDDKPKHDGPPQVPPGTVLSESERAIWDWLLEHVYVRGVHGTSDGASFVKVARLYARVIVADQKVEQFGMVMKHPKTTKPELQPYTRLSRDLWHQLGVALEQIGATPAGRVKLAGPLNKQPDATSWDDID